MVSYEPLTLLTERLPLMKKVLGFLLNEGTRTCETCMSENFHKALLCTIFDPHSAAMVNSGRQPFRRGQIALCTYMC